jgi:hypothetical protein
MPASAFGSPRSRRQQTRSDRQVRAGGVSADRDARGIDAECPAALVQPARDGFDLMQCERKPDFRRQRIVDTDDDDAGARGQFAHHAIVRVETEHGPAATMQVDQRWLERGCRVRPVQAHAHVALRGRRQDSSVTAITGPPRRHGARISSAMRRISTIDNVSAGG